MSKNMKKHFTSLALIAILMIVIPLFTIRINLPKATDNESASKKSPALADMLAYEYNENYCKEGLKAVGIILNSNYKSGKKVKTLSKKEFLKKYKNGESYYSLLEKLSEEINDRCITYKGKAVKFPYYYITDGSCKSEKPYLKSTANPWDLLNAKYSFDAKSGVSLNSINLICKKGLSSEECLNRFFKNTKITAVNE